MGGGGGGGEAEKLLKNGDQVENKISVLTTIFCPIS